MDYGDNIVCVHASHLGTPKTHPEGETPESKHIWTRDELAGLDVQYDVPRQKRHKERVARDPVKRGPRVVGEVGEGRCACPDCASPCGRVLEGKPLCKRCRIGHHLDENRRRIKE